MALAMCGAPLAAQAAPGGDVARAFYIKTMDQEFAKMDADKDGQVTKAEADAFQRGVALAGARARAQAAFAQLDKDKNGQLSFAEFAALQQAVPPADGRPLLAQYDSNKDGRISLVEHRAGKLARFDRIDTDKDGVVTVAEMKAAGVIK